jgi:peptidoglycan hydrolase-like protein with peptidoglycan-binding domain
MNSAYTARIIALVNCIVRSRTICWTSSTFNGDGQERNANDNGDFDLTWYTQALLLGLGYDTGEPDGVYGNRTKAAIQAFQREAGLPATGAINEDLFYLLLTHSGGTPYMVGVMEAFMKDLSADEIARAFSASSSPMAPMTLTEELATRNTTVQRAMIASYLIINDHDCPVPATNLSVDTATGTWDVSCSNGGEYTLVLADDGATGTIYDNRENAEPDIEVAQTEDPPQPANEEEIGAGIAFSHAEVNDYASYCIGPPESAAECAQEYCAENSSGNTCETVLTCVNRTWSAVATSPGAVRGMGFSCGYEQPYGAREVALAECLRVSRAICSLVSTVDPDGNLVPDEDDELFTRAYNAQVMLSMLNFYEADLSGEDDDNTRNAIIAFQNDIGIEPTGVLDDDLVTLLYYAVGGQKAFVFVLERDIYNTMDPATAIHHSGRSYRPLVEISYDEELRGFGEDERLRALATSISVVEGFDCTIPAISATSEGKSSWSVECAEGPMAVRFDGFTINVERTAEAEPAPAPEPPPTPTPSAPKEKGPRTPEPPREKTKG